MDEARWRAEIVYRSEAGEVDVEHFLEELNELQDLIERGPHWDALVRCTITLNRPAASSTLTIEEAAAS